MAGHLGHARATVQNLEVVETDADRGLILVKGAVPGAKGGWVLVSDARKRSLPEAAPYPAGPPGGGRRRERGAGLMQLPVRDWNNRETGTIELADAVFGGAVRPDLLARVVNWQRARRRSGAHKVKERGEVARVKSKIYRQKGTGRARHGAASANIFRGGGVAHGPRVRSHAHKLPKKVRAAGLRSALAAKAQPAS